MLNERPELADQIRRRIGASGLTPQQMRARLRAAGYPENLLDNYLEGSDTTRVLSPGSDVLDAVRVLGIVSVEEADSLYILTDSAQAVGTRSAPTRWRRMARGCRSSGCRSSVGPPACSSPRWRARWTSTTASAPATAWS